MRITTRWPLLLVLPALLFSSARGNSDGSSDENTQLAPGEQMYRKGILPNGQYMQATVAGDVKMSGQMVTCVSCHQRSGLGSVEGSVITWPVTGKALFSSRRRTGAWKAGISKQGPGARQRWGLPEQFRATAARPAYNGESLAKLLRHGINSAGQEISRAMPRYQLNDEDMAVLIHYLHNLSGQPDPGVNDEIIRFATVVTDGVSVAKREAMLSVLRNHIGVHNTQTRPHLQRAKKGPFYKTELYSAYRKFELDIWELTGPQESWQGQLDQYYRAKPVFALLGGIASGSWKPIHQFSETHEIPTIFPITDSPALSDSDWYTLYFDKGLYQEGETVARYLTQNSQPEQPVIQVFKTGGRGEAIAGSFEKSWLENNAKQPVNLVINNIEELTPSWFAQNIPTTTASLLVWLDDTESEVFLKRGLSAMEPDSRVFLSSTLLKGKTAPIPKNRRASVILTHPYRLSADLKARSHALNHWLKIRDISPTHLDIKAKMYFLGWMLPGVIRSMRGEFYRDYFMEGFEMMREQTYATPLYPRLSFAPGQRYAAKGGYITRLNADGQMTEEWISNQTLSSH